ncbi:unnamed protein product [Meganyctiphanes norvegica]|uniref:C2H2-type domain-containing protein n=1 Tax=Meganyctiphanes norvegica TaxID=48144 RepID=A0AAV2R0W3_MEGNR
MKETSTDDELLKKRDTQNNSATSENNINNNGINVDKRSNNGSIIINPKDDQMKENGEGSYCSENKSEVKEKTKERYEIVNNKNGNAKIDSTNIASDARVQVCESSKEIGESSHIKNSLAQRFSHAGIKMNTPSGEYKRDGDPQGEAEVSSDEDSDVASIDEDEYDEEEDDDGHLVISSVQGAAQGNKALVNHMRNDSMSMEKRMQYASVQSYFSRENVGRPDSTVAESSKGKGFSARENRGSPDSTATMTEYSANIREEESGHPDSTVMQEYSRKQRVAMLANNESSTGGWGLQIESSVSVAGMRGFSEDSNSTPVEVEEYVPTSLNKDIQGLRNIGRPGNSHNNDDNHYDVQIQQANNSNSTPREYVPSPVKALHKLNYKNKLNKNKEDDEIETFDRDIETFNRDIETFDRDSERLAKKIYDLDSNLKKPMAKFVNDSISDSSRENSSFRAQGNVREMEKRTPSSPDKAINWGQVSGYGEAFMKSISVSHPKSNVNDDHASDSELEERGSESEPDAESVSGPEYDLAASNDYDAIFLDKGSFSKNGQKIPPKQSVPKKDLQQVDYFDCNSEPEQNSDDDDEEDIYGDLDSLPNLKTHENKSDKSDMGENRKIKTNVQSNSELDQYEPELEKHMGQNHEHQEVELKVKCVNNSTVPATSSGRTSKGSMDSDRTVKYEDDSVSSNDEGEAGEGASVDHSSDSTFPGMAPGTPWVTQRGGQGVPGEKEYGCYKCGVSCESKSVLAKHMKMHTRDELFDSDDNRYHKRKRDHSDASSYQSDASSFTPDGHSAINKKRKQWDGSSPIIPPDLFLSSAYMRSPQRKKLDFNHGTPNESSNKRSREDSPSSPIDKEEFAKKHKLSPQAYKSRLSGLSPHVMKMYKKRIREGSTSPTPVEYDTTYNEEEHGSFFELSEYNVPKKRLRLADENQIKQNMWLIEFKWLSLNKEKNVYTCEFCKLTNDDTYVISEETSKLKRKDILNHASEECHLFAKTFAYASIKSVTLAQMRTLLLMCKKRIPLSNYPVLLNLQLTNGCEVLQPFNEGILHDIQATPTELSQYMSLKFERQLTEALKCASYGIYSLQADEAPFDNNTSILVIYVRYIDGTSGEVCNRFLRAWPAKSTSCEDIYQAIKEVQREKIQEAVGKDMTLVGFATDGASFMSGGRGGISRRYSNEIPQLISMNCLPHRLREISEKVANSVPYLVEYMAVLDLFSRTLRHTPNIFNSAIIQQELSEAQAKHIYTVLAGPTRASLSEIIQALASYIPSVLRCLLAATPQQEHILEGQALLGELLQQMTTYQFIAITHFLADCMGVMQWITATMQDKSMSLSQVIKAVHSTEEALGRLSTSDGPFSQELQVKFPVEPPLSRVTRYEGLHVRDTVDDREIVSEVQSAFVAELMYTISISFPFKYEMKAFSIFEPREEQSDVNFNELLRHYSKCKWLNAQKAREEWQKIKSVIASEKYKESNIQDIYQKELHNKKDYPNLGRLCAIGLLLSVDSNECEKGMHKFANIRSLEVDGAVVPYIQSQMVLQTEAPDSMDFPFDEAFQFWAQEKEGHEMPFQ